MKAMIDSAGKYQPGDLPPKGYIQWHQWADVQRKAGIRQKRCCVCELWKSPQEYGKNFSSPSPVCSECDSKTAKTTQKP